MLLSLLLAPLLARGDCCGIASDRDGGELSFFDDDGVDGVLESSAALVFGAKDTLLLLLEGEAVTSSCSRCESWSGDGGCSEALGDRVSDSKEAAFRTSSSFFLSFLSGCASRDSLGGVSAVTLPTLLPPGLRFAREASAKAEANSVGSTFFLSEEEDALK